MTMDKSSMVFLAVATLALLCWSCSDDKKTSDPDGGDTDTDTDTDADGGPDGGDGCIETASGTFPAGAVEIAHDEGGSSSTVLDFSWTPMVLDYGTYTLGEVPMWEAVRFDLEAPTTIYGARVQWGNMGWDTERAVTLGAYDDFGSNGFDFFQWEATREGDRCLTSGNQGEWIDYVFDEPVEMDQPGLFYIAHFWDTDPESPLLMWDETLDNDCEPYDGCHSSINMPEAETQQYYNGLSLGFPYDFAVRLMVEVHDDIPQEDKWFQDGGLSVSSRVAWGDYDNDGDDDLMTNGPTLLRNDGDGTFTDVTAEAGIFALFAPTGGGVWGDYDNDGWLDYMGLGTGMELGDSLLHNEGDGTFTDLTVESDISDLQYTVDCVDGLDDEHAPTEGVAWVDLNNDGFLDLYQAQYECGGVYANYKDRVWLNDGDGTFTDWPADHGFYTGAHAGRGVSPVDYDLDGDVDIFVSNYRLDPNFMYRSAGDGDVVQMSTNSHLAGNQVSGAFGHTIGAAWYDADNDGDWDIFLGNLAHPRFYHFSDRSQVMINDGTGVFTDTAQAAGIHYRETHSSPVAQDFNGDGYQDIFITCVYEGRFSEMYLNNGDGTYDQVNYESGAVIHNGWGAAASDYDNDGDVDLVAYELFRNDTAAEGNNWLQVRALGGTGSEGPVNSAGIGSVVRVTVGSETLMSHTSGGSGTGCQDSQFLVFGLGSSTTVDQIEVLYPGGTTVTVDGPIDAGQRVWVQANGTVSYGWGHPI